MPEVIDSPCLLITQDSDLREEFTNLFRLAGRLWDEGIVFEVKLKPKKLTRSVRQNALMWALLTDISNQVEWYGLMLDKDDWKELISASWREQRSVPKIGGGGFVVLGARTSKLSVAEMNELLDVIQAFGAEQGVKFSAPDWMWEGSRG